MQGRAWSAPARHWPDRPHIVAGKDHEAGGSWLGVNDFGVAAAILNRRGSLGAAAGKRSRGELVLAALDCKTAADAVAALTALDGSLYRSFNMAVADAKDGYWLRGLGDGAVEAQPLPDGVGMLTAWDLNDTTRSERTALYLPRFEAAGVPDADAGDWGEWQYLLESTETAPGVTDPNGAMTVETAWGFGTVSRSMVALPAIGAPRWRFASIHPDEVPFTPVSF